MFQRFFEDGLAHSSYLLGCPRAREAVVIDPRRDVDVYVDAARQHGLTITHAIETHIHADFVSGARELAAIGARPVAGPGAALRFDHHEARDGETLKIGDLSLRLLHTPGHTPEHVTIVATDPGGAIRAFTGDTLFVGAVGRPDLLGEQLTRALAADLYDSLFHKLLPLGDVVEVHPAHGAGSLCGAGIGREPHSTIGQERRFNPMLQHASRDTFVTAVLADLPETPAYFPRMKQVNHDGPRVLGLTTAVEPPPALSAAAADRAVRDGAIMLDLRSAAAFGNGHAPGAINIGYGSKIGYWAGWVVAPDARLVLMTAEAGGRQAAEAYRQLLRVGLERVQGYVEGGSTAWSAAGLPVSTITQITARDLSEQMTRRPPLTIVDVRTAREWRAGHIDGAVHIPVGDVLNRAAELPTDIPAATICEGGYRSSLAASLLERAGIRSILNVTDGMAALR
ncbi:MAG: MBL fold metallo-hydrolase [Acidobacteria bacterium]|nr:MBL fold metallo-hydrolase [Acidobacteriota bacterium]